MSSEQQDAFQQAQSTNARLLEQSYGIALPALSTEYGLLNKALSEGGEPGYLKQAYTAERGGLREASALAEIGPQKAALAQRRGAVAGGNVGAISPQILGSQMANALYGSRVEEATGTLGQINKLYGMSLGQAQTTGSGALAATGNELANIQGMRNYNPTYANILGALNLGGSLYGAFNQGGGGTNLGGLVNGAPPGTYSGTPWNVGGLSGVGGT